MVPLERPAKELDEKHIDEIVKFVSEINYGKLKGSENIALATLTLLETIINSLENATAYELCSTVLSVGRHLLRLLPHELVCGNIVRRVLRAIRDETRAAQTSGDGGGESLQRLVQAAPARRATLGAATDLRGPLRDHMAELRLELESSMSAICGTACEHVHSDELILSGGRSALAERFLRTARRRHYRLLLPENHAMAARLASAGTPVTVISNASVYAVMSRVNKVVIGVEAALAGGAALARAGVHAITLAAKQHAVPVIALAPLYALCPLQACDPRHFNVPASPAAALPYQSETQGSTHVFSPKYDYIPPDHITLFVTNLGGSSPSYIYRLLSELYDPADYTL